MPELRLVDGLVMVKLETAREFLKWQHYPPKPIIGDMILPRGSLGLLVGDEETYKSWLMLDMAWSVAEGSPWLIWNTTKTGVLLVNAELPKELYWERWSQMVRNKKVCPDNLWVINDMRLKLDTAQGQTELEGWVSNTGAGLVIIDNLYRVASKGVNDGQVINMFLDGVDLIRGKYNAAVVIVHHNRKHQYDTGLHKKVDMGLEDATGSKYLVNHATTAWRVVRQNNLGVEDAITLYTAKLTFERPNLKPPPVTFVANDKAEFDVLV